MQSRSGRNLRGSVRSLASRLKRLVVGEVRAESPLEMVWPVERLRDPPRVEVADGYRLRQFETRDVEAFQALLTAAGMPPCPLDYWNPRILSDGFFVIEHTATAALVATCFASHHPTMRHDRAGNFGWLAADPAHKGRKLGWTVSAAVTARLIAAGYKRIYLETHDFRLAALKIYTSMGWVPLPYDADMERRWRTVYETLRLPFTPGVWPR